MAKPIIGIAWYRPRDWERLRQLSTDSENLEDSHGEWLVGVNRAVREMEKEGLRIRKVIVDLDELVGFCQREAVQLDAAARSSFVAWKLSQEE